MAVSKFTIFAKVIELKSFTKAAEALGCTQSAVSHAIQALETEIGLKLVSRSRAGVHLTSEGEQLFPAIQTIVRAAEDFHAAVKAIHGLETGRIRVGAFTSVAVHWLPGIIKEYQQSHPYIEFGLMNGDYHDIAQWFSEGSIDMGFVTLPCPIPNCSCTPLTEDRLLAVLPKNHPLTELDEVPAAAMAREPFISLMENSDHDARSVLEQAGVNANIKFTTKDDYAIIAMVEQGLGVSIMPELLLRDNAKNVCLKEIQGGMKRTIGLAVSKASINSPSVQSFARHIQEWVQKTAERK